MRLERIDPKTRRAVTLTLEMGQWQALIAILHDAPYRFANPVISAILAQFGEPPDDEPSI